MRHPIIITIVGSREAPFAACSFLAQQSLMLRNNGVLIRTGDASKGIDDAIVNPWQYYEGRDPDELQLMRSNACLEVYTAQDAVNDDNAQQMAARYHPVWENLTDYAKLLHARNCYQIAGLMLNNPSTAVVCWTPDSVTTHAARSKRTGGTGTAISVASALYNIPVFNINNKKSFREYNAFIASLKLQYPG